MADVLRAAGRPLTRSELRSALGLAASDSRLLHDMVGRRPFVEVGSRTWGLVERDVPGAEEAFEAAIAAIADAQCATPAQALVLIHSLSATHASWSAELAASAYRVWKAGRGAFPPETSGLVRS